MNLHGDLGGDEACRLSPKAHALVRLAAMLAMGAAPVSYQWTVGAALDAGATTEEIIGTMIAVAPITGIARVVQATPDVALPIGYDLDAAFEELDPGPPRA
jgi:alkylhydroperoxidase/carboxymuconolactone decarboxylase family protein YurZ